ncbi:MAG: winged helix-turn-helix domain-containing protein [Candidatus Nitrosopolaris sp.]
MKYISRTDIVGLLFRCSKWRKCYQKTKLMYNAYLSFIQLREYLALLAENRISNEKIHFK